MKNPHVFLLVPTGRSVGLTSIALGLFRALEARKLRVAFYKPVAQPHQSENDPDLSTHFIRSLSPVDPPEPMSIGRARALVSENALDSLMEEVIEHFHQCTEGNDIVVMEGLLTLEDQPFATEINRSLARSINAEVILVSALPGPESSLEAFERDLEIAAHAYGGPQRSSLAGVIINKVTPEGLDQLGIQSRAPWASHALELKAFLERRIPHLSEKGIPLLGGIPFHDELGHLRTRDVARLLQAKVLHEGDWEHRRVAGFRLLARHVSHIFGAFRPGQILITPADRDDIILASALATLNGVRLAGLILTSDMEPNPRTLKLCQRALDEGLPILQVPMSSFETASALTAINTEVPADDLERINKVMDEVSHALDMDSIAARCSNAVPSRISPPAFRFQLAHQAAAFGQRIVLPEGDEPRTLRAAAICKQRKIAHCVLLGNPETIRQAAHQKGIELPASVEILDPDAIREQYVEPMVELRKHKKLTPALARDQLRDNVVLGTMMLHLGEVGGLVSGAVHSTANTIRPAFQLIRGNPQYRIVSSLFFMCLPDQVVVYADCAVNPDPNAEELADIAIQSADSARHFGIEPVIAMISYSTLGSGSGADVEKVAEATRLARERRPDLLIDGPLQYDAAVNQDVAAIKAPDSAVAGKATVFIFPDLNTGNTTYKAVQRSANVVSIGPMLQGLRKPVNDLSRGALVDDIVYTIALTAIQAEQARNREDRDQPSGS